MGVWGAGAMDPDDDDLEFDPTARQRQVFGQAEMRVCFSIKKHKKWNSKQ